MEAADECKQIFISFPLYLPYGAVFLPYLSLPILIHPPIQENRSTNLPQHSLLPNSFIREKKIFLYIKPFFEEFLREKQGLSEPMNLFEP